MFVWFADQFLLVISINVSVTIFPLLGPSSLDLPDKKDQIFSPGGHMANSTCRKQCGFHSSIHNMTSVTFTDTGFTLILGMYLASNSGYTNYDRFDFAKPKGGEFSVNDQKKWIESCFLPQPPKSKREYNFTSTWKIFCLCDLSSHLEWNLDLSQRFVETEREDQFSEETWSAYTFGMRDRYLYYRILSGHTISLMHFFLT